MAEGGQALRHAGCALALTLVGASAQPVDGVAAIRVVGDVIDLAPATRSFASKSGQFILTVSAVDGWKTPRTTAVLREGRTLRWRMALPHEGGPRAALVSDTGAILFVDEWINVIPRHALMVVDPAGKVIADHAGEAVLTRLDVPRRTIGQYARVGPWRTTDAMLSADGTRASLRAGGRTVMVSLNDGRLEVAR